MTTSKLAANQARIGIHNFTANASGSFNVQPLMMTCIEPLAGAPENNVVLHTNVCSNLGHGRSAKP